MSASGCGCLGREAGLCHSQRVFDQCQLRRRGRLRRRVVEDSELLPGIWLEYETRMELAVKDLTDGTYKPIKAAVKAHKVPIGSWAT